MSAALVILPSVWATASLQTAGTRKVAAGPVQTGVVERQRTAAGLAFYRKHTEGLLRRYVRLSMEAGRAPSLLGREMFRGKVTNYRVHGFDDVVIFVHDVEKCLAMVDERRRYLIERIALQEYTHDEVAGMTGLPQTTVSRRYGHALDQMTEVFLERKLLEPMKSCQ
jgi:hypothetical protein